MAHALLCSTAPRELQRALDLGLMRMQIISFCVAALYSGLWCLRWASSGGEERMWGQLRLFCGMVCAGSVAGAVGWGAQMQNLILYYEANASDVTPYQEYKRTASAYRLLSAFLICYGFEFLCLIISKLMLLGRLASNATQSSQADTSGMSGMRRRWLSGRGLLFVCRVMTAVVVVGSVVGLVASDVSAAYYVHSAGLNDQAARACDAAGSDTNSSQALQSDALVFQLKAFTAVFVQSGSEALTLLLVSVTFVVIVSWSVALFRMAERVGARALLASSPHWELQPNEANVQRLVSDAIQASAAHRWRLTAACIIVLVTFPARAAYDLLLAYSSFDDSQNPACGVCDPCQSQPFLIRQWLVYTPEFQPIVVALSSPLPLTLSLWLITKAHARARSIVASMRQAGLGDGR